MFNDMRSRVRSVVGVGVVAALVVAGLAFAQNNGSSSSSSSQSGTRTAVPFGHPPGPPPGGGVMLGGPEGQNLTYAEFHSQQNGQDQVTRLDRGKIDSVSDSEITITENDGNQVTVPVDKDTQVLAGPGKDLQVADLQQGQQVMVNHPEGGAADVIAVPPTKAQLEAQFKNMPKPPAGSAPGGRAFQFRAPPPGMPQG
jgi:hypothetical protein